MVLGSPGSLAHSARGYYIPNSEDRSSAGTGKRARRRHGLSGVHLDGKVALVTGGNSGIGLGMADALAQAGAAVCIWGTNEAKNAAALEQLRAQRVMRVNLDGAFFTLRATARHMVRGGHGGSLVITSSLAAISGMPCGEHYAATKGGAVSMMQSLAVELARYRIRVNAIMPGWIDTAMIDGGYSKF